ncbi:MULTISPECIES: translation elongation factor Ts [unclassified Siphonobacter]|uniref:translation elongation factor Ts n=1 Tax=unclassified Siphonobacter TaxID=2635712 RepID=UPI000CB7C039|nr:MULTISPECIES: translation elongation factor Ts [unclassified Siphonobacter]MDQ1085934.1 elongation factor Ts [Siphonobacter sp. SORGH_AS_1065]MDR6196260.1 elongation factor Ts [Siphonobacter sp. SORGH_AS_0500]PKK38126.1 translation elongation factor Ts [Siphonobacter sp. SORGH_AS_0500]
MAAITAADVNKLRQMTGAGMMDCKKALSEADGDFEKAIEVLRKAGQKVAAKRADNATSEGLILVKLSEDGSNGKLIALACETEPVSKVEDFRNLANAIIDTAVEKNPASIEELSALPLADGRTIQETITELVGKIGEKIIIATYENINAEQVVSYIHSNGKLGVLLAFNNVQGADVQEVGKDIAMQIAAMKPVAVSKDEVDPALAEKELEIGREQARAEGKPEAILDRIAQGRLEKFYKENTLLSQEFVKDNSITIAQLLEKTQKGLTVKEFKRVALA